MLFNWPTFGGGNVHTVQLARCLQAAGLTVRHLFAEYPPWGVGAVNGDCPFPSERLAFSDATWSVSSIRERFRRALRESDPDFVLITDAWNTKPLLAEAAVDFAYVLRIDAQECLCPLNNIRLRPSSNGSPTQCNRNFPSTPDECVACVRTNERVSGPLHLLERGLGWSTERYHERMIQSLRQAYAVLAVNPSVAAMIEPFATTVHSIPPGIDPQCFLGSEAAPHSPPIRVFFLGNPDDPLKGFTVLHDACAKLWQRRQDFRLLCTAEPPGLIDAFTERIGWCPHSSLPTLLNETDIVAVPSVCQDAMPIVALEAMAAARPIVASRIGGLQYSVADGLTGLLFSPGDSADLACKLALLLNDASLRTRMGYAGRRRVEERYSWNALIRKYYLPLFQRPGHGAPLATKAIT
ncbi:MAG: glycosyltransferase family 4 protein [Pirellulales bacterium]